MSLEEILSKIGVGKKETVYLSVTPGVGLELMQLSVTGKLVKNYAYKPLHYNESLRELADREAFKLAVTELFEELKLNTRCNVIVNIPMVLLGSKELPLLLGDEAITEALTSEAEQSYIFKRYEPVVSWLDLSDSSSNNENRKLYYSAIQKNVIDDLKEDLKELGMTLIDIQTSLVSVLRALIYSDFVKEQIKDGVTWNLMLISANGYSITSMSGKNIVDYYEEPLAIKSFDGEEIYNAINASAQIALMSYPANYLVVVSETDLVSAELLSSRLSFDGIISFYENNDFKRKDLINVSLEVLEDVAHKISLESIGVAVCESVPLPFEFNFMEGSSGKKKGEDPDEPIHVVLGNYEFDISQNGARNLSLIIAVLLLIPFLILMLAVPMVKRSKQAQLDDTESKLKQIQSEVQVLEAEQNRYRDFDVNSEMKIVLGNNRTKLMAFIALGESVPKKLYLTYFVAQGDGKFDVKGEASSVQDVYTFYKNMKESLINTQFRLQKLEMESDSVDDAVSVDMNQASKYKFEITNMSDSDIQASVPKNEQGENADNAGDQSADSSMLNKPLLNLGKKD